MNVRKKNVLRIKGVLRLLSLTDTLFIIGSLFPHSPLFLLLLLLHPPPLLIPLLLLTPSHPRHA
ncbi:MAG: hypothetical protein J3Q66DRAFT_322857 [Benniella sp.]|nr:MAG: hypothetical protein J3Q66DRAFT_322857 [Benniella sp.]